MFKQFFRHSSCKWKLAEPRACSSDFQPIQPNSGRSKRSSNEGVARRSAERATGGALSEKHHWDRGICWMKHGHGWTWQLKDLKGINIARKCWKWMNICSSKWLASEFELNNNVIMLSPTEQSLQSLKSLFPNCTRWTDLAANWSHGLEHPIFARTADQSCLRQNCLWQKPVIAMGKEWKRFIQTKTVRRSETAKSCNSDAKFLRFVWDTLQCHCHCHALQIRSSLGSFCHEVEQHMQCGKSWASLFFFMIQLMHGIIICLWGLCFIWDGLTMDSKTWSCTQMHLLNTSQNFQVATSGWTNQGSWTTKETHVPFLMRLVFLAMGTVMRSAWMSWGLKPNALLFDQIKQLRVTSWFSEGPWTFASVSKLNGVFSQGAYPNLSNVQRDSKVKDVLHFNERPRGSAESNVWSLELVRVLPQWEGTHCGEQNRWIWWEETWFNWTYAFDRRKNIIANES